MRDFLRPSTCKMEARGGRPLSVMRAVKDIVLLNIPQVSRATWRRFLLVSYCILLLTP